MCVCVWGGGGGGCGADLVFLNAVFCTNLKAVTALIFNKHNIVYNLCKGYLHHHYGVRSYLCPAQKIK